MVKEFISSIRALYKPTHIQYFKYGSYYVGAFFAYKAYDIRKKAWNEYNGIKTESYDTSSSIDLESLGLDADTIKEIRAVIDAPATH